MSRKTFQIDAEHAGIRLDKTVSALTELGRRRVRELFQVGAVGLDGLRQKASVLGREGQVISIDFEEDTRTVEPVPLEIVVLSPSVVIVNKPAGQPSTPARARGKFEARAQGTLAEALLDRFPEMHGIGYSPLEAGLIHRLDTNTSGLVLAARSKVAFEALRHALGQGRIEKRYYAVVRSDPRWVARTLASPLKPDPHDRRKVIVCHPNDPKANLAETRVTPMRRGRDWTLLDVSASRAYRHQIRAHLADIGFPLAGDTLYGAPPEPKLRARHALHAHYIAWTGDEEVGAFSARSPLPAIFEELTR